MTDGAPPDAGPCLPVGKLPADLLEALLGLAPTEHPELLLGPGVGLDCAVIDQGERLLVCKSDPVTFVTDDPGRYLVRVNANDIATTGAEPRWLMVTLLLPEGRADFAMAERIMGQIGEACRELRITLVGGHTEVTHGLAHPIAVGALLGEVARDRLVTPRGARSGDRVLLTKGVPIEGTAILAAEFSERLRESVSPADIDRARRFVDEPGISVVEDARIALGAGRVTAMHDPTEGGVAAALWELARASGRLIRVDPAAIPVPPLAARICGALGLDPLTTIASGALLLTVAPEDASGIIRALASASIPCAEIGEVGGEGARVEGPDGTMPEPGRDALAALFDAPAASRE
ncbi:AIR synthase [Thioalkalivibrio denitrificans]|uniref:AIR synthase n=1 Tax=Thioalkalivibrio denitrificans TaxID=108003 RepID=A0A1V3NJR8_9GAMM|nr:AIR synthase family protein [Thioalkalivibrio denitrificans]OOG25224.1 AIR synthase [Thioalkalivibrio denitrificans]